ncbi:signal peptidase I [Novosphingopyxis sp.]|uniref:signal peptidase I n=1 Tax=Novosphingopyxis sp. TaxID=2709690 RepID=UPI003B5B2C73
MINSARDDDAAEPRDAPGLQSPAGEREKRSEWWDLALYLLKVLLIIMAIRSFVVAPFNIPSESMQPRLLVGDYLLVAKWPYGYSKYSLPGDVPLIPGRIFARQPDRGDVVVFKAPPDNRTDYIKRVIGLPGDTVRVQKGAVFLNGKALPKQRIADLLLPVTPNMVTAADVAGSPYPCYSPQFDETIDGQDYCRYPRYRETLPSGKSYEILDLIQGGMGDDTMTFTVPEGSLFLMGDNRDRSADSRFPAEIGGAIGIVPQSDLIGRALVGIFSTDGSAEWAKPWTWVSAARGERIGKGF